MPGLFLVKSIFLVILQRRCFDHNGHSGGNSGVENGKVGAPGGAPATTAKTVAHGKVALGGGQNNATKGGNSSAADGDYQVSNNLLSVIFTSLVNHSIYVDLVGFFFSEVSWNSDIVISAIECAKGYSFVGLRGSWQAFVDFFYSCMMVLMVNVSSFSWCSMRSFTQAAIPSMKCWSSWGVAPLARWSSAGRRAPMILWPSRSLKTTLPMPGRVRLR